MEEKEKHLDEELNDFLFRCYQLKKKAKAELDKPNSLPYWLVRLLLKNNPSKK